LTDVQKAEMTETEISKWEEKAKKGILRNDSIISTMLNNLRNAFYKSTDGVGLNFKDIGIDTSSNYSKFELVIDETKLKAAIAENPEEVYSLFNKEGDTLYNPTLSSSSKIQRYAESGFAQRVSDIFKDAVRTTRNIDGYKGSLV